MRALMLMPFLLAWACAWAQPPGWTRPPRIVVTGAVDDESFALVQESIGYWNRALADSGTAFRLPPAERVSGDAPEDGLQALSRSILAGMRQSAPIPDALSKLPGELVVVFGSSEFVSFASPFFGEQQRRIIGIRGLSRYPLKLPNVARNVIAHELGHALGLIHNDDPTRLMCGRPANCGPPAFESSTAVFFPLTEADRRALARLYGPAALLPAAAAASDVGPK
nr:M57 family metalloprotease [Aquabacterium terrae]